jgi:cytochrome P450
MGERGAHHAAVVFGRDAQAEALLDNQRFPAAPGYAFSRPTLGDSLLMSDGPRHVAQRRLIQPAFATSLYGAYLARLEEALGTVLATWSSGDARPSQRAFYCDAEAVMFRLACRIILGATDEEPPRAEREYARTLAKWEVLQGGVTNPIHSEWFWPLRRVMQAARWLDRRPSAPCAS